MTFRKNRILTCLCLTSHEQLRSYGDRDITYSPIKPGIEPATPGGLSTTLPQLLMLNVILIYHLGTIS